MRFSACARRAGSCKQTAIDDSTIRNNSRGLPHLPLQSVPDRIRARAGARRSRRNSKLAAFERTSPSETTIGRGTLLPSASFGIDFKKGGPEAQKHPGRSCPAYAYLAKLLDYRSLLRLHLAIHPPPPPPKRLIHPQTLRLSSSSQEQTPASWIAVRLVPLSGPQAAARHLGAFVDSPLDSTPSTETAPRLVSVHSDRRPQSSITHPISSRGLLCACSFARDDFPLSCDGLSLVRVVQHPRFAPTCRKRINSQSRPYL